MSEEGGKDAVRVDEDVVPASEVRRLEKRVPELERLLRRKTMEVEILKEAMDFARVKGPTLLSRSPLPEDAVNGRRDLGVARSNMIERWAAAAPGEAPRPVPETQNRAPDIRRPVD